MYRGYQAAYYLKLTRIVDGVYLRLPHHPLPQVPAAYQNFQKRMGRENVKNRILPLDNTDTIHLFYSTRYLMYKLPPGESWVD